MTRTAQRGERTAAFGSLVVLLLGLGPGTDQHTRAPVPDARLEAQGLSGNPVIEGWCADPEVVVFGNEYWIYPTCRTTTRSNGRWMKRR